MLVYDITNDKSFDNIRNWIRNIEEVRLSFIVYFIAYRLSCCLLYHIIFSIVFQDIVCLMYAFSIGEFF